MRLLPSRWTSPERTAILWGRTRQTAIVFNRQARTCRILGSLDEIRPRDRARAILILRRDMYILNTVELPKIKKSLADKALQANIGEWSPYRETTFFRFLYARGGKVLNLLAIMKRPEFEAITAELARHGLKASTIIPETLCYAGFFKNKDHALVAIQTEPGVELLYFDHGIRDSQYIPRPEWTPAALEFFIKRIGPAGQALQEILWIGAGEEETIGLAGGTPASRIGGPSEVELILRGSAYLAPSFVKSFTRDRRFSVGPEDWRALRPAVGIVTAGLLAVFLALHFSASRYVRGLERELASLRLQSRDIEARFTRLDALRQRIQSAWDLTGAYPLQMVLLDDLRNSLSAETFFTRYAFHKDRLEISGGCPNSSDLAARLGTGRHFSDVKFKTAIEKNPATGQERFALECRVKS